MRHFRRGAAAAALLVLPAVAQAEETPATTAAAVVRQAMGAGPDDQDLARLSLEELSMVEVTSVSRRPEALADAAAAPGPTGPSARTG